MHIVCVCFVIKQTHSSSYFVCLDQKHPLATKWPVLANLRWTKTWSPYLCNTIVYLFSSMYTNYIEKCEILL